MGVSAKKKKSIIVKPTVEFNSLSIFFFFFLVGYLRFPMSPNEEGCLIQAPGDMFPIRKRYQNFIPEKNDRSVQ